MKRHFAWRPHLDRDPLFNPFIPSERTIRPDHVEIEEAYGEEGESAEDSASSEETPSDESKERSDTPR